MWRVISGQSLVYRCWDDEAVLYNDLSGATHLIGPVAICLLEALRAGPAPASDLASAVLAEFEIEADPLAAELETLLGELSGLGLIEPCPC